MPWYDDSWRATYDEWKLRSPYDEGPWEECDHEDYQIGWEGRAYCSNCSASWTASPAEIATYDAAERRADIAWQREHSWWIRTWKWLKARMPRRRVRAPIIDDDIPF